MSSLVVFDLDGTLLDTPRGIVRTFGATFQELNRPVPPEDILRATIGRPLREAFGNLLGVGAAASLANDAVIVYRRLFEALVVPSASGLLFPGVAEGLASLREGGTVLAVATNRSAPSAEQLLVSSGIRDFFGCVVGFDGSRKPKPDPEPLDAVASHLGLSAGNAWVIGDTAIDIAMARARGAVAVAVSYGVESRDSLAVAHPDFLVDSFEAVVEIIPKRLRGVSP
jgi:phosphoglycolate phosphatase